MLNKKIGVIGVGNIGKKIIEMIQGFETINYVNDINKINKNFLLKYKLKSKTKKFIFNNCDIIIIATDLNKTSIKLINKKTINQFKNNPLIVNIGRGGSIDNQALLNSLKRKKIKGACLDVFENEPLSKNNLLKKYNNCILTSHNAFNTKDEVEFVNKNTLNNIFRGLNLNAEVIKKFKNKKVIVTGHTGFKGSWLALWLHLHGAKVMGLSNKILTDPSHFRSIKLKEKIISKKVDICDIDKMKKIFLNFKPDFVFHLAAQAIVKKSYINPVETYKSNTLGTLSILECLRSLKNKCGCLNHK